MSLYISHMFCDMLYLLWSVSVDNGCNKRGQTSRLVVRTEIQTCCNFEANLRDSYYLLVCVHYHFNNVHLTFCYNPSKQHNLLYLLNSTRAAIGQFSGPYSTVRPRFSVRTVNYGPLFFPSELWPARFALGP